jgi:S-formylglutathione hydrolase FrmB
MRPKWIGIGVATLAFLAVGSVGAFRYADTFWLYRGFPPPTQPKSITVTRGGVTSRVAVEPGTVHTFLLPSPALGGRQQIVYVFLPPGYTTDTTRRYPVLYLLHGHPGGPATFLLAGRIGVLESVLVAQGRMTPTIIVMPFGTTGFLGPDEEWANGVRPNSAWETFFARDVVNAIDARYRTIATGSARAIGGLSEGGYGAINIGLHHPDEFSVLESWSGYERAFPIPAIFDRDSGLLAYNSPMDRVVLVSQELRASHAFVWFYSGGDDPFLHQNRQFADLLSSLAIQHQFLVIPNGGHSWRLWRAEEAAALLAASDHLAQAQG